MGLALLFPLIPAGLITVSENAFNSNSAITTVKILILNLVFCYLGALLMTILFFAGEALSTSGLNDTQIGLLIVTLASLIFYAVKLIANRYIGFSFAHPYLMPGVAVLFMTALPALGYWFFSGMKMNH